MLYKVKISCLRVIYSTFLKFQPYSLVGIHLSFPLQASAGEVEIIFMAMNQNSQSL